MLKDVFGFPQCLEKGTFGLGYKLTFTRNVDNVVLKKKITQSTMLKSKLMLLNGMYRILHLVFEIKQYYLSKF